MPKASETLPAKTKVFADCAWVRADDPTREAWLLMPPDAPVLIGINTEGNLWRTQLAGEIVSQHDSRDAAMLAAEQYMARPEVIKSHAEPLIPRANARTRSPGWADRAILAMRRTTVDKPKRKYPLTSTRVVDAVKRSQMDLSNPGFCLACGYEQDGCEPDARKYRCEECGAHKVYGAEEILMMTTA